MNVVINNCIFTDPRGDKFRFDTFFVQARNIRCVHIPPNVSSTQSGFKKKISFSEIIK